MITAASAGTWTLGDLTVNRIGFGAMRMTGNCGVASDRERVIGVLRRAVELGVNHIDTAAFYFSPLRSANELINTALSPYAGELVITTKVGPGRDPSGEWLPLARPDQLRGQVEENLRQLGRDHLDVVNLRQNGLESVAEHFGALADLRTPGSSGISACRTSVRSTSRRHRRSPRWSACRTRTASTPDVCTTSSCAPAGSRASPSCRSSRSPATDVRQVAWPATRPWRPSPGRTGDAGAGAHRVDPQPRAAHAGHPRYGRPRPSGREPGRRGAAPVPRGTGPARLAAPCHESTTLDGRSHPLPAAVRSAFLAGMALIAVEAV